MTNEPVRQPRLQCDICDQWSRELVQVVTEFGRSSEMRYNVHEHEAAEMSARVKLARKQLREDKAKNLREYGQRFAH